ncbi:nitrite reductase (NADH) small subunit [Halopseudomonas xinjiangensis]|uniref:Nitrite reductase (NADH) small subunit n=1 Tax=Halopseudomonas xinjiangensis TaxID=487184 RepID=A0A1H1UM86_9GAMM|nr:nitrite reductase small subunit NirD [Halopseudomonas xinjiangensis]SDS73627.1 nitrite reductase (NADH) small subunit [Halopseudomonas xinjiangensis]
MSSIQAARIEPGRTDAAIVQAPSEWKALCKRADLVANSGVVAWLEGRQVALFYLPATEDGEQVFAIENRDPKSGANVIGRGLVGQVQGDLVVASPLYKQHFRLEDGSCVEYPEQSLQVWPARITGDVVEVGLV